ncbi:exopolysaccharide biosynthesis polyprenyl glycosylphosphotransferase [Sphingomonas sp. KR1UV-12]|uniref:Exopolysaccharide biosynthesis polyprenyl glycosylphosphotransferase n=1 Tax=Sphingomonas aurea TaxID=3063994 RepID=A0ABT9EPP1_9SPHN|nr:exopolysaccharide biosynthesis polyprenyl glycosylphosphotransferase [Sphingomonas sp. KR1UV-12]MDP1028786.1 exopolysaccharide biosynthesis polyprenyl glycosylphosphotransferase [Sphingomonas sp. KR1UV-12]
MTSASRRADTAIPDRPVAGAGPARDKRVVRLHCYLQLALSDLLMIAAAFVVANYLVSMHAPVPIGHGYVMLGAILPLFAIQACANGTYGAATLDDARLGTVRAGRALATAGAGMLLVGYMLKASGEFSRGVFGIGFAAAFVLMIVARRLLRPQLTRMLGGAAHTTVVIRDGAGYVPQGAEIVVTAEALGFDPETADPRAWHRLAHGIAHADRMVVACEPERAAAWAPVLRSLAVDGEILTDVRDALGAVGMGRLGERRTLIVNYGSMTLSARMAKRAFDITVSLVALALLAPVLAMAALAIRVDSPGPVLFRQERIGRGNRIFSMWKFRSMYVGDADAEGTRLTGRGDTRVTRVGALIRRTSIDELPQLWNVLKGDMSIVGPRPHALAARAADLLYWDADARYRERHVIKPGMTGLAQIRGFRGNTVALADLTDRLQADLDYVGDWSLRRDVAIMLGTLKVMLHPNAY